MPIISNKITNTTLEKTSAADIELIPLNKLYPSPENDAVYHPVNPENAAFKELVESVREKGILDPIIITSDRWIVSGHRRYAAAKWAALLSVPCRRLTVRRADLSTDEFAKLLREHNRQREKTLDERRREALIDVNRDAAYAHLKEYRRRKSAMSSFSTDALDIGGFRARKRISDAKAPMVAAVQKIVNDNSDYWPLSDRQIHYRLLNDPPLIHASKPGSTYRNDERSYKGLTNLLTRMRLVSLISWESIGDETRPHTTWRTWPEPGAFVTEQANAFLGGYWRDLMQSQPAHIEIIGEKLTVKSIIERVAGDFTIAVTIGRGYCSLQPRHALAERFKKSGRDKLVLLLVSDFDPDGEGIAESFARSLRDDFDIDASQLHPVKVALTAQQVKRFGLPPSMKAKESSSRFADFSAKHGADAWELEALPPETLAAELRAAIENVLDLDALEHERQQEAADAQHLEATRRAAIEAMGMGGGK